MKKEKPHTPETSPFSSYIESMMKDLSETERADLHMEVISFIYSKKKEIIAKRRKYIYIYIKYTIVCYTVRVR